MSIGDLQIVILENPFECWKKNGVPELFKLTVELKRLGYEGFYPHGFLPVDSGDFVATHLLICEKTQSGLVPIAGYRSISLKVCETYHLPFPLISALARDTGVETHSRAIRDILENSKKNDSTLTYGSSWTIHPRVRSSRMRAEFLKDIARAIMYFHQTESGVYEELGLGVPKVKTDRYFNELGYEPMKFENQVLPLFRHNDIGGAEVMLLHRKQFTDFAVLASIRHQKLWHNRLVIHDDLNQESEQNAA